jgi:hypothetical protein
METIKTTSAVSIILLHLFWSGLLAQDYEWKLIRPGNTGIPGELVQYLTWAPDHKLWVAARWPFWEEGGIGTYHPDIDLWSGWSSFEHPLPSELIHDIEFDAQGNAWIATAKGLVKYDGSNWTLFDNTNSYLQNPWVADISIGTDGTIWINNSSSNFNGDAIWAFDGVSDWQGFFVPDDLPWPSPWTDLECVLAASDGSVYVANEVMNGLAKYDGNSWTLLGESIDRFARLTEDNSGNIWMIGNPVGGANEIYKYDGNSFSSHSFQSPMTLANDSETGAVYAGNWYGEIIRTLDEGQNWQVWATGLNHVFNIAPRPGSDEVWVGTISEVARFEDSGVWIEDLNTSNTGMPDYFIDQDIMLTHDGILWFASGETGVSRYDGLRWRNWSTHNAGSEPWPFGNNEPIYGIYRDNEGTVWMGGNGIARWDPLSGSFTGFWNWQSSPPIALEIKYFAEDNQGDLFAFSYIDGIFKFNGLGWDEDNTVSPAGDIKEVLADSQGNIWLAGTYSLHKWDGSVWTTEVDITEEPFFDAGGINCFEIDTNDVFWFGTMEGLFRWDGLEFTLFDSDNAPLPASNIRGIDIRSDGLIGISAAENNPQSGIAFLQGDPTVATNWEVFHYGSSPQPHWQLEHVAFDARGDFWVSAISMGCVVIRTGNVSPELLETNPFDKATQVDVTTGISASFDAMIEAIDLGNVIISPEPTAYQVNLWANMVLIEHNGLDTGTTYTISIPAGSITNGSAVLEDDIVWSFTTETTTGIFKVEKQVSVYPNPSAGRFVLQSNQNINGKFLINDLSGKIIRKGTISTDSNMLNLNGVSPGIYILTLHYDNEILMEKLIIR